MLSTLLIDGSECYESKELSIRECSVEFMLTVHSKKSATSYEEWGSEYEWIPYDKELVCVITTGNSEMITWIV